MNPERKPASHKNSGLVLKVDVDTLIGLDRGVPRLARILGEFGIRASFFIAMGPDHSGRALKRLVKPGFLAKQLKAGAASAFGVKTMLYGLVLPGPIIARELPRRFHELTALGHEVGVHGWDHVFWHDRVRGLSTEGIRLELGRAYRLFHEINGFSPAAFASPGWQVTPNAYAVMASMGFTHVSCTRGVQSFRPLYRGKALPLIEIPTTMPSLDEILGRRGVTPGNAGRVLAGYLRPGRLNVFTLHAEVEGRGQAEVFRDFLSRALDMGIECRRLVDAAASLADCAPPVGDIAWAAVPGRAGDLAVGRLENPV